MKALHITDYYLEMFKFVNSLDFTIKREFIVYEIRVKPEA